MVAMVIALACATVLGLAAWMTPSPTGIGTHSQLRLPPCGWIVMMDMPCPTCGMTTAFSHAAHGQIVASFLSQPMGCLLAIATAMTLWISLLVAVTGSPIARYFGRMCGARSAWIVAAMILVAWGYKILSYKGVL
jgi:hypothetical protein